MPDPWYPEAARVEGLMAGYSHGRNQMRTCVCHFTVGTDSTAIGVRGYFQFLVRRDGQVVQFCEVDALAWHAGDWNSYGPGIEVEYLPGRDDAIFTPEALAATGGLVRWLNNEWGIPLNYFDGERIDPVWDGFIAHRSLKGGDHTDWWPREDWDQMVSGSPATKDMDDMVIAVGKTVFGVPLAFLTSGGRVLKTFDGAEGAYGIPQSALDWKAGAGRDAVPFIFVDPEQVGVLAAPWPVVGGSGGAAVVTDADVERIAAKVADVLSARLKQ